MRFRSVSVPPFFLKGGQGGFYIVSHSYESEHIYDIRYKPFLNRQILINSGKTHKSQNIKDYVFDKTVGI